MADSEFENLPSFINADAKTAESRVSQTEPEIRTMQSDIAELLSKKSKTPLPSATTKVMETHSLRAPAANEAKPLTAKTSHRLLFIVFGVGAVFLLGVGAYYYYFILQDNVKAVLPPAAIKPPIQAPRAFVSMEKSRNIVARAPDFADFLQNLNTIQNDSERDGILKRIVFITQDKNDKNKDERLGGLKEFLTAAKLILPRGLADFTGDDFNLFLYYQANSVRRGVIIPINNETKAFRAMVAGEEDFFENWRNLYAADSPGPGFVRSFEDVGYRNIDIRRITFSAADDLGFYYAIFKPKKYLIVTTSFESMKTVLERVFDAL